MLWGSGMTITIEAAFEMKGDLADDTCPPIDSYADHELAMLRPVGVTFEGGTCTADGVFPDTQHKGVADSDRHHVHAICYAGVVHRVSVSFLSGTARAGWIFYFPKAGKSGVYSRFISPRTENPAQKTVVADDVFRKFFDACPKGPGATANAAILDARNKKIALEELMKKEDEAKKASIASTIVVSQSKRDAALFAQTTSAMNDQEIESLLARFLAAGGILKPGDDKAIAVGLRRTGGKESWPKFVQSYYDPIMAFRT